MSSIAYADDNQENSRSTLIKRTLAGSPTRLIRPFLLIEYSSIQFKHTEVTAYRSKVTTCYFYSDLTVGVILK